MASLQGLEIGIEVGYNDSIGFWMQGEKRMSIRIHLHTTHRQFTDGRDVVEVKGVTIGECLGELIERFPKMKEQLFDKNGKLKNIIEIYLNNQSAYPDELARPTKDNDEIFIVILLAGG